MRRLMPSIPMILILGGCATPGEKTAIGAGAGRVSILTDMAMSIDEAKGEEARQWAEARPWGESVQRGGHLDQRRARPLPGAAAREAPPPRLTIVRERR